MDADAFKNLQDDEQREDTAAGAMRSFVKGELVDVHTTMPGIIQSFDPATQTATVQPAIRRFFVAKGWVNLPPCMTVPVEFPRGGNFIVTFPVRKGDECELAFNERCIDAWWDRGGVQEPAEDRMHDLSDAVARLGVSSRGRVPANIATDALEIRTLNGDTVVRVEDDVVILGRTAGAEPAVKGDVLATILTAIAGHTHPETGGTTGVSATLAGLPDPRSSKVKVG